MTGRLYYAQFSKAVRVYARDALPIISIVALSACATPPAPTIQAKTVQGRTVGVGTLATWGSWEMDIAPVATRAQVLANRAATDYKAGRIGLDTATSAESLLTRARDQLAAARRGNAKEPTPAQRAALSEARRLTDLAVQLLEP